MSLLSRPTSTRMLLSETADARGSAPSLDSAMTGCGSIDGGKYPAIEVARTSGGIARPGAGGTGVARTQPAEQVLGRVGDGLQPGQSEKACGSLDRVQCAKNTGERLALGRGFFQSHQIEVELSQILVGLKQKFANDFVHERNGSQQ